MEIWQQVAHFFIWHEAPYVQPRAEELLEREARRFRLFGWTPWFSGLFTRALLDAYERGDEAAFAAALLNVKAPVAYQAAAHLRPEDAGIRWHTSDDGAILYYGPGPVFNAPPDDGPFTVGP
jgi:hypothetical protein